MRPESRLDGATLKAELSDLPIRPQRASLSPLFRTRNGRGLGRGGRGDARSYSRSISRSQSRTRSRSQSRSRSRPPCYGRTRDTCEPPGYGGYGWNERFSIGGSDGRRCGHGEHR